VGSDSAATLRLLERYDYAGVSNEHSKPTFSKGLKLNPIANLIKAGRKVGIRGNFETFFEIAKPSLRLQQSVNRLVLKAYEKKHSGTILDLNRIIPLRQCFTVFSGCGRTPMYKWAIHNF